MSEALLSIRNLRVDYITANGAIRAVDRVSLDIAPGEIVGIAGESGSGKSTLAKAVMRILPPPGVISGGEVWFQGRDILRLDDAQLREIRWRQMSMVFQSAMDALNPVITVGEQIADTIVTHTGAGARDARRRAGELLDMVGIPAHRLDSFAHQLSGGMRQRVGIALALALEPSLVILDEPTTALDVIVEREILRQVLALQRELGFAVLFITHDLARMLQVSHRVAVFYAARLVEIGPAAQIRNAPLHPYTAGLLRAVPSVHAGAGEPESIPGVPPSLEHPPHGCRFHPRCPMVVSRCKEETPELRTLAPERTVACHEAR
jgi:peptide/nickel transport system ATP-binding protein